MSREPGRYLRAQLTAGAVRFGLYLGMVCSPLLLAFLVQPETDHSILQEIAKGLGLVGYTIVALQPILAARYRWIERALGLDLLLRFHRAMGLCAAALLLAHPLLYAGAGEWELLLSFTHGWPVALGKVALAVLVLLVITTVFRRALKLSFETWRGIHNGLAASLLILGFIHSIAAGGDLADPAARVIWFVLFAAGLVSQLVHWRSRTARRPGEEFRVTRVERETEDVWSLDLEPLVPEHGMDHLPGQFLFLTLHRTGRSPEQHPFTIASARSPTTGRVTVTIKACGDFTRTIGETVVGDRAMISGPYGRFSHRIHSDEAPLVFIAGGVGITPMLSMLRHMREVGEDRSVLLLYGSRREGDIIAAAELHDISKSQRPSLRVVNILSEPHEGWSGARGYIDQEFIEHHCGGLAHKRFYISGPPPMIHAVARALRRAGVPSDLIHYERFAL